MAVLSRSVQRRRRGGGGGRERLRMRAAVDDVIVAFTSADDHYDKDYYCPRMILTRSRTESAREGRRRGEGGGRSS